MQIVDWKLFRKVYAWGHCWILRRNRDVRGTFYTVVTRWHYASDSTRA